MIIVCRQERDKGTGAVIESLPLILRKFPNARLDAVGDGGALVEFKNLAATHGAHEQVTFHGKVGHSEVIRLLQQAGLFCVPTAASEGFPKAVLEALVSGLPVVTTRVSVLPQLVGAGCGLLLDDVFTATVANAVRMCLSDARRYRAMSR